VVKLDYRDMRNYMVDEHVGLALATGLTGVLILQNGASVT
jgi:hypothetical protein